ncbi:MAG: phosphoribosylformylglycinamidine synthase subunit PurQ [Rickettsiales bacterium]
MKAAVITFPGSNCDRDMREALAKFCDAPPVRVWHGDAALPEGIDLVALPGGFSYGDYLRCGALASRSPVMEEVRRFAARGGYVLGVCNGFQILAESGLLPGALIRNAGLSFVCKNVGVRAARTDVAFTSRYDGAALASLPVAHHDGNYVADADLLKRLQGEGRAAFYYAPGDNPNGSSGDVAGVYSENFRVLGMMPHPERAVDADTGGTDGIPLFASLQTAIG